jgi:hypothetical protein
VGGGDPQQGLVRPDGAATPAWDEFKKLGRELEILAPLALKLKRAEDVAVVHLPIDAATLEHVDGAMYLIVTNLDIDRGQEASIRIDGGRSFTKATDVLSGKKFPIAQGILKVSMAPGEGLALKLE